MTEVSQVLDGGVCLLSRLENTPTFQALFPLKQSDRTRKAESPRGGRVWGSLGRAGVCVANVCCPCRSAGGPEQDLQQSLLLLCGRDAGGRRVPRPCETLQAGTVLPAPSPGGQGRGSPREKSVAGHPRRLSGDGPGEDRAQSSCKNGARLTPASVTAAPQGRGGRGAGGPGGRAADHPPAFRLHFKGNVCENHYQHPSCFLLISFLFCLFFMPKQKQWSAFLCISLAGFSSNTKTHRRTLGHIPVLK